MMLTGCRFFGSSACGSKIVSVKESTAQPKRYWMPPENSNFARILFTVLVAVAEQHPHHVVFQVIASGNSCPADCKRSDLDIRRQKAIGMLLQELSTRSTKIAVIVDEANLFCAAYTELALLELDNANVEDKQCIPLDPSLKICSIGPLEHIHIPTVPLNVDRSGLYENIVGFKSVVPKFELVDGINMAKKIHLIGTDDVQYSQLVKGNDNPRQDAVLVQVFGVVNSMFKASTHNALEMPSYIVVPISHNVGIIQWVDHTVPMGSWLRKARRKFNLSDWKTERCHALLMEESRRSGRTAASTLQVFNDVQRNFSPVLRYFFLETFADPRGWYFGRLKYAQTCAVSFIIGYVLGIGDRHVNNMLLAKSTGSLIHVDFGIAFEQGKRKPIFPELVPGRLTRDIVDGMGFCGTVGAFREAAVETLSLLRENKSAIMSVLDVVKFDPLYAWKLPVFLNLEVEMFNGRVERALGVVRSKLSMKKSVERQVDHLISEARDPSKLALMFPGWQAWS
eukprot:Partr_v1_DN19229_c0_g1_i1_m13805 putative ataxia telangiectasia mutated